MPIGGHEIHRRFAHWRADEETAEAHRALRAQFEELAGRLDIVVPDGREKSLMLTHLETAMFYGNAAIARPVAMSADPGLRRASS